MKTSIYILTIALVLFTSSCMTAESHFDASGSFEAIETIISSETSGIIKEFNLKEGQQIDKGYYIGYIDSTQLYLKKRQLEEQIESILSKRPNVSLQLATLETQLATAKYEQERIKQLVKDNAAASKQQDDINGQVLALEDQIEALRSTLTITSQGITNDANTLSVQIDQLNDQLEKCRLSSPMKGTVLTTYARENEMTVPGKPLYKIADLSEMELRVFISGDQLAEVKLNQKVKVLTDSGDGGYKEDEGVITWISDKGEFTPKTIQTKNERANMVYAVKVNVKNDGTYKIGMYGEIIF